MYLRARTANSASRNRNKDQGPTNLLVIGTNQIEIASQPTSLSSQIPINKKVKPHFLLFNQNVAKSEIKPHIIRKQKEPNFSNTTTGFYNQFQQQMGRLDEYQNKLTNITSLIKSVDYDGLKASYQSKEADQVDSNFPFSDIEKISDRNVFNNRNFRQTNINLKRRYMKINRSPRFSRPDIDNIKEIRDYELEESKEHLIPSIISPRGSNQEGIFWKTSQHFFENNSGFLALEMEEPQTPKDNINSLYELSSIKDKIITSPNFKIRRALLAPVLKKEQEFKAEPENSRPVTSPTSSYFQSPSNMFLDSIEQIKESPLFSSYGFTTNPTIQKPIKSTNNSIRFSPKKIQNSKQLAQKEIDKKEKLNFLQRNLLRADVKSASRLNKDLSQNIFPQTDLVDGEALSVHIPSQSFDAEDEDPEELFSENLANTKLMLLESIFDGRPSTVFFQYPPCCKRIRESSRAYSVLDQNEENAYDLKYKSGRFFCVVRTFETAGFKKSTNNNWNLLWGKPKSDRVKDMNKYQKVNHFPGCWQVGRKDNLWRNISRLRRQFPNDYDFVPNTYILGPDYERFNQLREAAENKALWIMKPCASACGRGIQLLNKKSKIKKNINYLACDYIANPHLINNRKYDLRIYVLVNSFDPLKIYMHNEGLVRFCTADYTTNTKKLKEKFIHLTNWSVNKNSPNFIPNEDLQTMDASKWTFTSLKKKFIELGLKVDEIFSRIEDIIIKTLISAEPYMLHSLNRSPEHRNNCFELYGFDVLLDSNLKPWLMEVNVCPSLNASSELDRRIKTIVMCDIMNLLGFYPYDKKKYDDDQRKKIPGSESKKYANKNINDLVDLNEENCIEKLSIDDWNLLFEIEEEFHRKGDFKRIYPTRENVDLYEKYFEFPRYNNQVISKFLKSNLSFLEKICKKKTSLCVQLLQ